MTDATGALFAVLRHIAIGMLFVGYIALGSCHLWRLSDGCEQLAEQVHP